MKAIRFWLAQKILGKMGLIYNVSFQSANNGTLVQINNEDQQETLISNCLFKRMDCFSKNEGSKIK